MTGSGLRIEGRYYQSFSAHTTPRGHATDALTLGIGQTALVLVDVYGLGFDDGDDKTRNLPEYYALDPIIREIVRDKIGPVKRAAKRIGMKVVYVGNRLNAGLSEGNEWRNMSIRTCNVDVLEAWREPNEILAYSAVIAPADDDIVIHKQMYSGFFETSLDSTLRGLGIRNLIMVGFDSRVCLATTAIDALYRDYRVIVIRDCVHTHELPETEAGGLANLMAIRLIESIVGYTVTSDQFIVACELLGSTNNGSRSLTSVVEGVASAAANRKTSRRC
jgi:nicotinamidase-related amidase